MSETKLIVAVHKKYEMPKNDIYLPLQVGSEGKDDLGYEKDNTGENISSKNYSYCELTGLYWAWKNLKCDYIGLVHYRRYFKGSYKAVINGKKVSMLSNDDVVNILNDADIILPKKRHYWIETNESQYLHAHHSAGLIECGKALKKLYPEYEKEWNDMLKKRSGHRFNMFVSKKELADNYCKWLFDILEETERNIDISDWNKSEQRVFGYLSERLLDVYVNHNNLKIKNQRYSFIEKQNWFKKGFRFIKRKFGKKVND